MRKNIATPIIIIGILSGALLGVGLMYPILKNAENDAKYWYNQYNDLSQDIDDLIDMYNDLSQNYNDLFGQYQSLLNILENPLTNPVIPTISEILTWLYIDDTDKINYTQYWMCGDFSAMLMTRAKGMNWRMRIAVMEYSFSNNPNYYVETAFGSYGHAFNLIYCSDGYWYYIEPQTDTVWYLNNGNHFSIWSAYIGLESTVWSTNTFWVNYYNYFA